MSAMIARCLMSCLLLCSVLFGCGKSGPALTSGGVTGDGANAVVDSQALATDGLTAPIADTDKTALDSNTAQTGATNDADGPQAPKDIASVFKDTGVPMNLVGQPPPQAKGLPSFSGVEDHTGAKVKPSDLLGHWTVMWFFPMAGTPG